MHQSPVKQPITTHHAFSLVELSIVLVILGLLVGGILSGQALIRASELRSVSTEQQRYFTAIQTFRDKYLCRVIWPMPPPSGERPMVMTALA
ncbi:MAG: type II secretion system protein [Rickettsiales bacterium]